MILKPTFYSETTLSLSGYQCQLGWTKKLSSVLWSKGMSSDWLMDQR
jgi:hypothetical protein